jgi:DnaJ domain
VTGDDPFRLLGLPSQPDLSDDEVRAAWRRIAAATHPDRPDGGDGERFATAAAAYAVLRTAYGRGEAFADLRGAPSGTVTTADTTAPPAGAAHAGSVARREQQSLGALRLLWRMRNGRPAILTLRVLITIAVCWTSIAVAGWQPATLAIVIGSLTWLTRTARYDVAR